MPGAAHHRGESRQDFATPPELVGAIRAKFKRPIAWDLAATNENAIAHSWLGPDSRDLRHRNSLVVPWHKLPRGKYDGMLYLNPPFAHIEPWAEKCAAESADGAPILLLTPASVGSNWFRDYVFGKARVWFLNGRITFVGATQGYPKDCMISQFGPSIVPGFSIWTWR